MSRPEDNPLTRKMIRFSQNPYQEIELALFNKVGPALGIPYHEDLLTWIESDEVGPFFDELRRSWLEPEANSFADLKRRVHQMPCIRKVYPRLMRDFIRRTGKFMDTRTGKIGPRRKNLRSRNRRKKNWKVADHWALFIAQVYDRARDKTNAAYRGADVPMEERELPSLWPGAQDAFCEDSIDGLYMLLRCLVVKYYVVRMDQVLLEQALDSEAMEKGF